MEKERRMFIVESKNKFGLSRVECLFIDTPPEECKRRIRERESHPTLLGSSRPKKIVRISHLFYLGPEGDAVVDDFVKRLNRPQKWEGFDKIMITGDTEELEKILEEIKQYPSFNK